MAPEMNGGYPVGPLHHREALAQWPEIDRVGAEIERVHAPERQEIAVLVKRQRRLGTEVAGLIVGQEALAAVRRPLYRPPGEPRRPGNEREFGREGVSRAEIAAHVAKYGPALLQRHAEHRRQPLARLHGAAPGGGAQGVELRAGVVFADDAARLHGHAVDAVDMAFERHDMGRVR